MTDARVVLTTLADPDQAHHFARQLVELHLAACVNIVERVHSIYRWQGAVETADEVQLIIKTTAQHLPALKQVIERLHPYEMPELIVLDIIDGSEKYLAWLRAVGE